MIAGRKLCELRQSPYGAPVDGGDDVSGSQAALGRGAAGRYFSHFDTAGIGRGRRCERGASEPGVYVSTGASRDALLA